MTNLLTAAAAWVFGPTIASANLMGAVLSALFLTLLAIYPVLNFLTHGWTTKKQDIFSSFSTQAKTTYLTNFLKVGIVKDADKEFEAFYVRNYGWTRFVFPLALFFLVCFALMFLFSETAISQLSVCGAGPCKAVGKFATNSVFLILLQPVAAAGIIGGYLWVVAGFIAGSRRYDLTVADVLNGALRLAVSAAIGYAISSLLNQSIAPFVAFAAGAFPLPAVNVILRRLFTKQLGIEIDVTDKPDQVVKLDGVDTLTADQLHDSGITTIPQMAYCDPVQLCMRTGLAFDFLSDVSAQALAWNYLGNKIETLKQCGLRTSIEIKNLRDEMARGDKTAIATLSAAAKLVNLDEVLFMNVCDEIAGDPYTLFLTELWSTTLDDNDGNDRRQG